MTLLYLILVFTGLLIFIWSRKNEKLESWIRPEAFNSKLTRMIIKGVWIFLITYGAIGLLL